MTWIQNHNFLSSKSGGIFINDFLTHHLFRENLEGKKESLRVKGNLARKNPVPLEILIMFFIVQTFYGSHTHPAKSVR